jgi:uncharacterized cupin superfamily protein
MRPRCKNRHVAVPEAPLEETEHGLAPAGDGWFVLNAGSARWWYAPGRGAYSDLEGAQDFPQQGFNIVVLGRGEPMSMYHWEVDQEDFLVVAGEALLIVEGEERPLRQWDFVHCPSGTTHTIVGAGSHPAVVIAVGARQHQDGPGWGGYTVDEAALRHDAGVERETNDPERAYAHVTRRELTRFRPEWLREACALPDGGVSLQPVVEPPLLERNLPPVQRSPGPP